MAAGGAGGSEGDRAVVTNVVSASKRGSMMEQGKLVKYHEVPVHRFCERWLYRYGGDSAEQVSEQKRMPFKVVPATEVDSDHRLAIADWHETKGKGESFVEYRIQVQSGNHGPSWDVWHRYSDFEKLHEKLFKGNVDDELRVPPFPAKTFTWKKDAAFYEKRATNLHEWIVAVHDLILERELSGDATLPYYHLALRDFLDSSKKALAVHHEYDSDHDSDYDSDYDYDKSPPPPPLPPRPESPDTACCASVTSSATAQPGTPERRRSRSITPEAAYGEYKTTKLSPSASPLCSDGAKKPAALEDRLELLRSKIDDVKQADDAPGTGGRSAGLNVASLSVASLFDVGGTAERGVDLEFYSDRDGTKEGGAALTYMRKKGDEFANRLKQIERIFTETGEAISDDVNEASTMAAASFNELTSMSSLQNSGEMSELEAQKFYELQGKMAQLKEAIATAQADADRTRAEAGAQWDQPTQVEWAKPKTPLKAKGSSFTPSKVARMAGARRTPKKEGYAAADASEGFCTPVGSGGSQSYGYGLEPSGDRLTCQLLKPMIDQGWMSTHTANWLDEEELGNWNGVKLTAASMGGLEQVQSLDFGGFGIAATMGRLARLFRCLTELTELKLSGNPQLEGKLSDVADMTALQVLNLSATKIGGELSATADLTCLTELVLDNSLVEGELYDLESCPWIRVLSLFKTNVEGDIKDLGAFSSLCQLNLGLTRVSGDLGELSCLTSLTILELDNTDVKGDLKSVAGLRSLHALSLASTGVEGEVGAVAGLTNLRRLNLGITVVSGHISELNPLTALRCLYIDNTNIRADEKEQIAFAQVTGCTDVLV